MFTAILNCFGVPELDAASYSDADTLDNLSKKAKANGSGPIVVFPEVGVRFS